MICAVYANMTWSSQDQMHKLQSFIFTTSLNRQKVCGVERHFFVRHLEIWELLNYKGPKGSYTTLFTASAVT